VSYVLHPPPLNGDRIAIKIKPLNAESRAFEGERLMDGDDVAFHLD
jgi:hypothetical protein